MPAINHVEAVAKKKAADLLSKLDDNYPSDSQRARFPLHATWGAVVSLNFDAHWLANHSLSWGPLPQKPPDFCSMRGKGLALRSELLRPNLTWVTEMLYRPVCFAGSGMSDAEAGLWCDGTACSQLRRDRPGGRPPGAILLKRNDPRLPFRRTRPCGIEPLICATWDEGWAQVLSWGEQFPNGTTNS